jgi:hypothetical protein
MVAEHQLLGMGLEKDLPLQVLDVVAADVVPDQRDGNDQRDEAPAVVVDEVRQLTPRGRVEMLLQMAGRVLEDVRVAPP